MIPKPKNITFKEGFSSTKAFYFLPISYSFLYPVFSGSKVYAHFNTTKSTTSRKHKLEDFLTIKVTVVEKVNIQKEKVTFQIGNFPEILCDELKRLEQEETTIYDEDTDDEMRYSVTRNYTYFTFQIPIGEVEHFQNSNSIRTSFRLKNKVFNKKIKGTEWEKVKCLVNFSKEDRYINYAKALITADKKRRLIGYATLLVGVGVPVAVTILALIFLKFFKEHTSETEHFLFKLYAICALLVIVLLIVRNFISVKEK